MGGTVSCAAWKQSDNPPVMPLAHVGCDLRVELLPGTPINVTAYLPNMDDLIEGFLEDSLQFLTNTPLSNARLPLFTDDQFSIYSRRV